MGSGEQTPGGLRVGGSKAPGVLAWFGVGLSLGLAVAPNSASAGRRAGSTPYALRPPQPTLLPRVPNAQPMEVGLSLRRMAWSPTPGWRRAGEEEATNSSLTPPRFWRKNGSGEADCSGIFQKRGPINPG